MDGSARPVPRGGHSAREQHPRDADVQVAGDRERDHVEQEHVRQIYVQVFLPREQEVALHGLRARPQPQGSDSGEEEPRRAIAYGENPNDLKSTPD